MMTFPGKNQADTIQYRMQKDATIVSSHHYRCNRSVCINCDSHCSTIAVCHAELNAIVNRTDHSLKGCTMYTTLSPCFQCAKLIIRSGIKEVVYAEEYRETAATEKLMEYSKFHCYRYLLIFIGMYNQIPNCMLPR